MSEPSNLSRATDITLAWLASPHTRADADQAGVMLAAIYEAVERLTNPAASEPQAGDGTEHKPAVGAKASLKIVGRIISMIDGKPYASLVRHLKANGLTPEDYRARYNLPKSYPMVAPAYSEARSKIARTLGFGRGAAREQPSADDS